MQSALASQDVVSEETHAPPSAARESSRHTSQASPLVVMLPFEQNSVAQAVWQPPLVPQSQAWMSAMRASRPAAWMPWQHVTQVDASAWQVASVAPASTAPLLLPLPLLELPPLLLELPPLPLPELPLLELPPLLLELPPLLVPPLLLELPPLLLPTLAHASEACAWTDSHAVQPAQVNAALSMEYVIASHSPAAFVDVQTFMWLPSLHVVPLVQLVPPPPLLLVLLAPLLPPPLEPPPLDPPPPSTPVPGFVSSGFEAPEQALTSAIAASHPSKPALMSPTYGGRHRNLPSRRPRDASSRGGPYLR